MSTTKDISEHATRIGQITADVLRGPPDGPAGAEFYMATLRWALVKREEIGALEIGRSGMYRGGGNAGEILTVLLRQLGRTERAAMDLAEDLVARQAG